MGAGKRVIVTNPELLHQWRHVLRLKLDDTVTLFDGSENEAIYQIKRLSKKQAELLRQSKKQAEVPKKEICLAWSLLKRENNEFVIQKATELGVSRLTPLLADRCVRSHVSQVRSDRWQKIITEAAEQCGRSNLPILDEPKNISAILQQQPPGHIAVCRVAEQKDVARSKLDDIRLVLVGPEGGWSPAEEQLFDAHKLASLQLGQFTLRAETAAMVAVSKIL